MLMDIWAEVVSFLGEHCIGCLIAGLIFVVIALIAQFIVNASLEEDLIELTERVEDLEKLCGMISEMEDGSADSENLEDSEEE